jgi:hypothetical protein
MAVITNKPSDEYLLYVQKSVTYNLNNECYESINCRDQNGRLHRWQRVYNEKYNIPTVIPKNGLPLPYLITGFQEGTTPATIWKYIENIVNKPCNCCNN